MRRFAILNHNTPAAYFVPAETYEWLMDKLEDFELAQTIQKETILTLRTPAQPSLSTAWI